MARMASLMINLQHTSCLGSGRYNKVPQTGGSDKQWTSISHSSGGRKSEVRGPAWLGSGAGRLLADCQRTATSSCGREQGQEASSLVPLKLALTPFARAPPSRPHPIVIASRRPYSLIPSHGGAGWQRMSWGVGHTFRPQHPLHTSYNLT